MYRHRSSFYPTPAHRYAPQDHPWSSSGPTSTVRKNSVLMQFPELPTPGTKWVPEREFPARPAVLPPFPYRKSCRSSPGKSLFLLAVPLNLPFQFSNRLAKMIQRQRHGAAPLDVHYKRIVLIDAADDQMPFSGGNNDVFYLSNLQGALHPLEARQDNALVSGDKTNIVRIAVTMLHDRFTFPIHHDGTDSLRHPIHQVL